jgi:putative pyruvate formate lyase activating enzyme
MSIEPGYLALFRSGELERRALALEARLAKCDICPRECGTDRLQGKTGYCQTGALAMVSSICDHHGEEPALSGTRGSGTIFFANCNMACVYCQNFQISQSPEMQCGNAAATGVLAEKMLYLQNNLRCHNVNLVTPSHVVPQIVRAVLEAAKGGLRLPLVYNTSSYDSLKTLHELDGVIDIYLADIRYASNDHGLKYSHARGYVDAARAAIKEMYRQVGNLQVDSNDIAQKGLIVRHLILPNGIAGSKESLAWLAKDVSPEVTVSIMSQYYPVHKAAGHGYSEISRKITYGEYQEAVDLLEKLGMENGWTQEMESSEIYRPDFSDEEPFEGGKLRRERGS